MEQDFAGRLYRLRRERGISQEELAVIVGVSRQAVQKWESGASRPDMDNLAALSGYFGVSLDYLVLGTGERTAPRWETAPDREPWEENGENRTFTGGEEAHSGGWSYEYKSAATLFGLPLVHVNFGAGRGHKARGIVAVGNSAVGLVAVGYAAVGLVSAGLVSTGLLAFGCLVAGIAAFGAAAVGALLACGGIAVGWLALGGVAVGAYAMGGLAVGMNIAAGGMAVGHIAIGNETVGEILFHVGEGLPSQSAAIRSAIRAEFPHLPRWLAELFANVG